MYREVNEAFDLVESLAADRDRLRLRADRAAVPRPRRPPRRRTCGSWPRSTRRRGRTWSSSPARSWPARSARPSSTARSATPGPAGCTRPASTPVWPGSPGRPAPGSTTAARRPGSSRPRAASGSRTPSGAIAAKDVIVATNAYADGLLPGAAPAGAADRQLHRHHRAARRRRARRGQPPASHVRRHQELPLLLADHAGRPGAVRRAAQPQPRVAGRGPRLPDRPRCGGIHPQLGQAAITHQWSGYVAITLDRMPHAGRLRGAWYATGCNGSGVATNTVARPPRRAGRPRRGGAAGGGRARAPGHPAAPGAAGLPPRGRRLVPLAGSVVRSALRRRIRWRNAALTAVSLPECVVRANVSAAKPGCDSGPRVRSDAATRGVGRRRGPCRVPVQPDQADRRERRPGDGRARPRHQVLRGVRRGRRGQLHASPRASSSRCSARRAAARPRPSG